VVSDVIVVGAGISGLRFAELAASYGLDVLVLEKKKSIGGSFGENLEAFPEYHYSGLDFPIPTVPVKEVSIFCGEGAGRRRLEIQFESPVFRMVKRGNAVDSIDSYLYERTRKTAVKILFGEKFECAKRTENGQIRVRTFEGAEYVCKILIAADGVFSTVKKSLGLVGNQKTEGVGYIAKVENAKISPSETIGVFNYKRWPGSYCYLLGYPNEDYATVGMTIRSPYANADLRKYFESISEYLPEILGEARVLFSTRGFVTLGSRDRALSASVGTTGIDNVLLIGEAGGFQDPTLAFGLAPALASARLAANCAIEAISENDLRALNGYALNAREELVKEETKRLSFRYVLETLNENEIADFLAYLAEHPERIERVMRTGDYLYNFLPMVLRSAARNPKILTFPFRYARVSNSLKNHRSPRKVDNS
jgi:flavin-dependent dehydrogenase